MNKNVQQFRGDSQGFTLVELAVVMIIIGILIGGILKGQELITNARVTSSISQMQAIGAAYNGFRDQFNAVPGDIRTAQARITNCTAATTCNNGDGDNIIDTNVGAAVTVGGEGSQFFRHLLFAGLITGMDGANVVGFGQSNPTAAVGGGFTAGDARNGVNGFTAAQLGAAIHVVLTGTTNAVAARQGILTPQQAANLDRRLDDGAPNTGSVIGQTSAINQDCAGAATTAYGNLASQVCAVAYRL